MNYAESLTYWYLRLNGFFPITNFVLHQPYGKGQSTDCDVLAVRFPHSRESISNDLNVLPCDRAFFEKCGIDLDNAVVGIIGQVKSGGYATKEVRKGFDTTKLVYSLHRLGVLHHKVVDEAVGDLLNNALWTNGETVVAKLLVDTPQGREESGAGMRPWSEMTVEDAEQFILKRFKKYAKHKSGARMFFGSDLVQYLAWKSGAIDVSEPKEGKIQLS